MRHPRLAAAGALALLAASLAAETATSVGAAVLRSTDAEQWAAGYAHRRGRAGATAGPVTLATGPGHSRALNPTRAPGFELGVQDDAVLVYGQGATPARGFDLAAGLRVGGERVRRVRFNVVFGAVNRDGWGPLDTAVDEARRRGLRVQLTIMGDPTYGPGSRLSAAVPDVRYLEAFAGGVAEHFAGRVDRYSVWNEPDHRYFLLSRSPAIYRRLYLAGRRGILREQPDAQVCVGEVTNGGVGWLRRAVGRGLTAECIATHYRVWPRSTFRHWPARTRTGGRPLVLGTEYGYQQQPGMRAALSGAVRAAKRAGMRELVLYQLVRSRAGAAWDTGLFPRSTS